MLHVFDNNKNYNNLLSQGVFTIMNLGKKEIS